MYFEFRLLRLFFHVISFFLNCYWFPENSTFSSCFGWYAFSGIGSNKLFVFIIRSITFRCVFSFFGIWCLVMQTCPRTKNLFDILNFCLASCVRRIYYFRFLPIWKFMSPSMIRTLCWRMCRTRENSLLLKVMISISSLALVGYDCCVGVDIE